MYLTGGSASAVQTYPELARHDQDGLPGGGGGIHGINCEAKLGRPKRLFQEVKESNDKIAEGLGMEISYDHDSKEEEEDRCICHCTQLGYCCNDDHENDDIESTTIP